MLRVIRLTGAVALAMASYAISCLELKLLTCKTIKNEIKEGSKENVLRELHKVMSKHLKTAHNRHSYVSV